MSLAEHNPIYSGRRNKEGLKETEGDDGRPWSELMPGGHIWSLEYVAFPFGNSETGLLKGLRLALERKDCTHSK